MIPQKPAFYEDAIPAFPYHPLKQLPRVSPPADITPFLRAFSKRVSLEEQGIIRNSFQK
jgi:hypothetical protein